MTDVFNRVMETMPNTFVTFDASGPVSHGLSPMPYSVTSLSYIQAPVVPGGGYSALGDGSLTFTGQVCSIASESRSFSIEMIMGSSSESYTTFPEYIMLDIEGIATLYYSSGAPVGRTNPAIYIMIMYGDSQFAQLVGNPGGSDHVVINVKGDTLTMHVNGHSQSVKLDPEAMSPTGGYTTTVFPEDRPLWGVAIRPNAMSDEYIHEISSMVRGFPTAAEAEEEFNSTTFDIDKAFLNADTIAQLEDIDFGEAPFGSQLYNGKLLSEDEREITSENYGPLPMSDTSIITGVISEGEGGFVRIVGPVRNSGEGGGSATVMYRSEVGYVNEVDYFGGEINELGFELSPSHSPVGGGRIGSTTYLFTEQPAITSSSIPDRTMTIDYRSIIRGGPHAGTFANGLVGRAFVEPDASASTTDECPRAYNMWVLVSVPGVLATSDSFNLSINSSMSIVSSGVSSVYIDGQQSLAALTTGWHMISFIPATRNNDRIQIGHGPEVNLQQNTIGTFSCLYGENPESYMEDLYRNYINPHGVSAEDSNVVSITDSNVDIYSRDWSISSAD